jgi:hypothetical protein
VIPFLIIGGIAVALALAFAGKSQVTAAVASAVDVVTNVVSGTPMDSASPENAGGDDNVDSLPIPEWRKNGITTDPNTWPGGDAIWDICRAIAKAEGYDTNGAAFQLNNPGDLSPGDEHGFTTAGAAEFHGGSNIIHFATAADGWNACYVKVRNIVNGTSKVYGQNWTISQIAGKWAGNSAAWAANVARVLGLNADADTFAGYVNG